MNAIADMMETIRSVHPSRRDAAASMITFIYLERGAVLRQCGVFTDIECDEMAARAAIKEVEITFA